MTATAMICAQCGNVLLNDLHEVHAVVLVNRISLPFDIVDGPRWDQHQSERVDQQAWTTYCCGGCGDPITPAQTEVVRDLYAARMEALSDSLTATLDG